MRLTIDLNSLRLIKSAGDRTPVAEVEFKRGDSTPIEFQFVRNGVPEALPGGVTISLGMKEDGKYDSNFVVFHSSFTGPSGADLIYSGTLNLNTIALNNLLGMDGSHDNDVPAVNLMGEVSWSVAGASPVSIRTFIARVHNDVIRGDEGVPTSLPTPEDWLNERAVRHDGPQGLAPADQLQARANIKAGIIGRVATRAPYNGGLDLVATGDATSTAGEISGGLFVRQSGTINGEPWWRHADNYAFTLERVAGYWAVKINNGDGWLGSVNPSNPSSPAGVSFSSNSPFAIGNLVFTTGDVPDAPGQIWVNSPNVYVAVSVTPINWSRLAFT